VLNKCARVGVLSIIRLSVRNMFVIYAGLLYLNFHDFTPIASIMGVCVSSINALG